MDNRPRVRDACKRRMPLDGSDAQALEHALTMTERERDEARAEVKRLREECNRMSVDLAVARTERRCCVSWPSASAMSMARGTPVTEVR